MAARELNSVKLCYAEAAWLFARIDRESTLRRSDEARIATELAAAEKKLQAVPNVEARKRESDAAVAQIASIAVAAFDAHLQSFDGRVSRLRKRRPTAEMVTALELIEERIRDIRRDASILSQKYGGAAFLNALAQGPAIECCTVHGLLSTCERAANSVRGWLGSRRDWVVAVIVAVVVGLLLIPVTLMIADWWNTPGPSITRQ